MKKLIRRYREYVKRRHARKAHEAWSTEWTLAIAIILMGAAIIANLSPGRVPKVAEAPSGSNWPLVRSAAEIKALPLTELARAAVGHKLAPLEDGALGYTVTNKGPGPKVTRVEFDDFDPDLGQYQTVTVRANHSEPIRRVTAELMTDHNRVMYEFERVSGGDLDGVWKSQWMTEDTHDLSYRLLVRAESTDPTEIMLVFR